MRGRLGALLYAASQAGTAGWTSAQTLGFLGAGVALQIVEGTNQIQRIVIGRRISSD